MATLGECWEEGWRRIADLLRREVGLCLEAADPHPELAGRSFAWLSGNVILRLASRADISEHIAGPQDIEPWTLGGICGIGDHYDLREIERTISMLKMSEWTQEELQNRIVQPTEQHNGEWRKFLQTEPIIDWKNYRYRGEWLTAQYCEEALNVSGPTLSKHKQAKATRQRHPEGRGYVYRYDVVSKILNERDPED